MKIIKKSILLLIVVLLLCSCSTETPGTTNLNTETNTVNESENNSSSTASKVKIATWNIRILSDGSRDDTELQQIASVFSNFDFVAVQEVRDITVLNRLKSQLSGWDYIVSAEVGNTVKERYAYFYKSASFIPLGTSYVIGDPNNLFIREPYIAHFRTGDFDFTAVTIHTIYGDTVAERRAENALLDDVVSLVDTANGAESDVMLMGDFNLPADDSAWEMYFHSAVMPATVKTTISDTSSYDNIWIRTSTTRECDKSYSVIRFDETDFGNDDDAASLAVSDHRPVITNFTTAPDDDEEGNWNQSTSISSGGAPFDNTVGDIRITNVVYTPTDSESITITNYSPYTVDLTPWTLGDLNNPSAYNIPNGTTIGAGTSNTYEHSALGFGINDSGETIYLKRSGVTIDTW